MSEHRRVFEPKTNIPPEEVFQVLRSWKQQLVMLEKHPDVYEGQIEAVSENGELSFSTVTRDEGKRTLTFDFSRASFQQYSDPGDRFDDAFIVFPPSRDHVVIRQYAKTR